MNEREEMKVTCIEPDQQALVTLANIEDRISVHMQGTYREILAVGRCLVEAKEAGLVPHGQWEDWVRRNTGMSERQAQRLKKLTEDVVEASKASTGSIPVNLERTDLNVLLSQAAGEFTDRFAEQKLELRFSASQEQTYVMADGRLLWRVFSNLMSNVGKYALEGTRVYLSIDVQRGRGVISLKNISRYPLNVSGEELMERFVRGDKSRTSEGSGLGLSIARSLTELQGGVFDITVDGDLFKVTISFETA